MATVKQGGGTVQVTYVTDLTGTDNKIIKRNVRGNVTMHLGDIKVVDSFFTKTGKADPNKCKIFHEHLGWMVLEESFDYMTHLKMDGTVQVKGFRQKHYGKYKPIKQNKSNGKARQRNIRNSRKNA